MRERRDTIQNLSILFLKCPKIDSVQSAKLPRMFHWYSMSPKIKKPKMTNPKMINTKRTKLPRKKASTISTISKYAIIVYIMGIKSPTNMKVDAEKLSLKSRKQSLP